LDITKHIMKKLTFEDVEKEGVLLYKYERGSLAQGTFIEGKSDIDTCSVYLAPTEQLLGLGFDYQDEVSDEKHDNCAWEFNKYMRLLLKSNPTVLESLFVDDEFIVYEHPIITELKKYRDAFVTKKCFVSFGAYAVSQIKKCRSLNKKILHDAERHIERRSAMSFCYTYHNQGSTKIENWLAYRGLYSECCGLNKIPNMKDEYGVFYDWGQHWEKVGYTAQEAIDYYNVHNEDEIELRDDMKFCVGRYLYWDNSITKTEFEKEPIYYRGIFKDDDSTEVRLSSIDDKNDRPICHMSYNKDGFTKHCKDYKDYIGWVEHRNPVRYADNKDTQFDAKNVSHSFRLMQMCIEIAKGEGFKVNRRNIDREFLLDVKMHKYEYDEIIEMLDKKKVEMDEAISKSTLPDDIDVEFVNSFVIKVRKKQLGIK
jgi:uncharacterized protein